MAIAVKNAPRRAKLALIQRVPAHLVLIHKHFMETFVMLIVLKAMLMNRDSVLNAHHRA